MLSRIDHSRRLMVNNQYTQDESDDSSSTTTNENDTLGGEITDNASVDLLENSESTASTSISMNDKIVVEPSSSENSDNHNLGNNDSNSFTNMNENNVENVKFNHIKKYKNSEDDGEVILRTPNSKKNTATNIVPSPASQTLDALTGLDADGGGNLMLTPPAKQSFSKTNENAAVDGNNKKNHNEIAHTIPVTPKVSYSSRVQNIPHSNNSNYTMHVIPFTNPSPLGMHIIETPFKTCEVHQVYENSQAHRLGIQKGDIICDLKDGAKEAAYEDVIAWSSKTRSVNAPLMLAIKRPIQSSSEQSDNDKENREIKTIDNSKKDKNVTFAGLNNVSSKNNTRQKKDLNKKSSKQKMSAKTVLLPNNDIIGTPIKIKNKNKDNRKFMHVMGISIHCRRCCGNTRQQHHLLCPKRTKPDAYSFDQFKVGLRINCKRCSYIVNEGKAAGGNNLRHSPECPKSKYYQKERGSLTTIEIIDGKSKPLFPVKCMHCLSVSNTKERDSTPLLHHLLCQFHPHWSQGLINTVKNGIGVHCKLCKHLYEKGVSGYCRMVHSVECLKHQRKPSSREITNNLQAQHSSGKNVNDGGKDEAFSISNQNKSKSSKNRGDKGETRSTLGKKQSSPSPTLTTNASNGISQKLNVHVQNNNSKRPAPNSKQDNPKRQQTHNLHLLRIGIETGCSTCLHDLNNGTWTTDKSKHSQDCPHNWKTGLFQSKSTTSSILKNSTIHSKSTNQAIKDPPSGHVSILSQSDDRVIDQNNELMTPPPGRPKAKQQATHEKRLNQDQSCASVALKSPPASVDKSSQSLSTPIYSTPIHINTKPTNTTMLSAPSPPPTFTSTPMPIPAATANSTPMTNSLETPLTKNSTTSSSLQHHWETCPNPWGISGHIDIDKILLAPHFSPPPPMERFATSPLSISHYQESYECGSYEVLQLKRDRSALRPWGFEVKRCKEGGACVVESVSSCSPAEFASDIGSKSAGDGNDDANGEEKQFKNGLRVGDIILCSNGELVGGMNEMELAIQLEICGPELILVIARCKHQEYEMDWIDYDDFDADGREANGIKQRYLGDPETHERKNVNFSHRKVLMNKSSVPEENSQIATGPHNGMRENHEDQTASNHQMTFNSHRKVLAKKSSVPEENSQTTTGPHNGIREEHEDQTASNHQMTLKINPQLQYSQIEQNERLHELDVVKDFHGEKTEKNKMQRTKKNLNFTMASPPMNKNKNICDIMTPLQPEILDMDINHNEVSHTESSEEQEGAVEQSLLNFGVDSQMTFSLNSNIADYSLMSPRGHQIVSASRNKTSIEESISSNEDKNSIISHSKGACSEINEDNHEIQADDCGSETGEEEDWGSKDTHKGCVCGKIHAPPTPVFWVMCDKCQEWFNVSSYCVGFGEEDAANITTWNCRDCSEMLNDRHHEKKNDTKTKDIIEHTQFTDDISLNQPKKKEWEEDFSPPKCTYAVGAIVRVAKRLWSGVNKPGGVGKVLDVQGTLENNDLRYVVNYTLGGGEKDVDAKYVSLEMDSPEQLRSPSMSTRRSKSSRL